MCATSRQSGPARLLGKTRTKSVGPLGGGGGKPPEPLSKKTFTHQRKQYVRKVKGGGGGYQDLSGSTMRKSNTILCVSSHIRQTFDYWGAVKKTYIADMSAKKSKFSLWGKKLRLILLQNCDLTKFKTILICIQK